MPTANFLAAAHRGWANFINRRGRWPGHLFDGRFASVAMDEAHLISAMRYVALNPVRARLAARAEEWGWTSVRAHLGRKDNGLVTVKPVPDRMPDFAALIAGKSNDASFAAPRAAEQTGRPFGTADFIEGLEPSYAGASPAMRLAENRISEQSNTRTCCGRSGDRSSCHRISQVPPICSAKA